jgi:15-cis-phytoene synthase
LSSAGVAIASPLAGRVRAVGPTTGVVPTLAGVAEARLRESFAECARITRERARNFYHGLRLTPEPRRGAIYSIYTWMRAADDLADEPTPSVERRVKLAEFRAMTERLLAGEAPAAHEPEWAAAFAATCASYPIDPIIFAEMLEGLEEDLDHPGYANDAALAQYCYRVAGTAGLACLWIWGLKEGVDAAKARELALHRGQAFQRTNILRDFAQDFDETPSRRYIPAAALAAHDMTAEDLRAWRDDARCTALVLEQVKITRDHYAASGELETMIDPACAPTLWAMTRIYSGLLDLIEQEPSRIAGDKRIRLAGAKKASIALGAALWAKVGRW